jgi:hypothetical protein
MVVKYISNVYVAKFLEKVTSSTKRLENPNISHI